MSISLIQRGIKLNAVASFAVRREMGKQLQMKTKQDHGAITNVIHLQKLLRTCFSLSTTKLNQTLFFGEAILFLIIWILSVSIAIWKLSKDQLISLNITLRTLNYTQR
jgi:hypothetical protein